MLFNTLQSHFQPMHSSQTSLTTKALIKNTNYWIGWIVWIGTDAVHHAPICSEVWHFVLHRRFMDVLPLCQIVPGHFILQWSVTYWLRLDWLTAATSEVRYDTIRYDRRD